MKNNAAEVVRDAAEKGRTLVVTQNGEAKAVLMGVEQYQEWRRTLALLKMVAQGEADIAAGRVVSQSEALARARKAAKRAGADE